MIVFMSTLIVISLFGLGFAFLATQNTAATTFNLLGYTWTLPMYLIFFGALLIGFFISWIVSSINTLGTWFNLLGKDSKLREIQQIVTQLQSRIRELELENAKLQGHDNVPQREVVMERSAIGNRLRNFMDRFKRSPAY